MQTLEIKVPDAKTQLVKNFLEEMGIEVKIKTEKEGFGVAVKIKAKGRGKIPNADTIAAMEELKVGNGKKFKSVEELFKSI
jgi:hypothetical protein